MKLVVDVKRFVPALGLAAWAALKCDAMFAHTTGTARDPMTDGDTLGLRRLFYVVLLAHN